MFYTLLLAVQDRKKMNTFNRIFNADECASTQSEANYFNTHPYMSNAHHHAKPLETSITKEIIIKLTNCRLIRDNKLISDDLWIRNGIILDPLKVFYDEKKQADMEIDCDKLIIAPGFLDLQLNGAFGRDFTQISEQNSNIEECLDYVATRLLQFGVVGFCPTIISSQPNVYEKLLPKIRRTTNKNCGQRAQILGVHLEGPFLSREKMGAHDRAALRTLDNGTKSLEECYGMSIEKLRENVSIVTLAPELDPDGEVCRALTQAGICASIGHSIANLKQGEMAIRSGARFITHLFNAMLPFHHRDPHLIGLLSNRSMIEHEQIYYGIIADNIHTHPSAINIAYKAHSNGLVLVTDAISAMGLDENTVHRCGNQSIEIVRDAENGGMRSAYLQGTRTLCGSVATIDDCVRNLIKATGCTLVESIRCASEHPAKLLGLFPHKGSLDYGSDADFIILDENVNVKATFIDGDLKWSDPSWSPLFKYKYIP